MNAKDIYTAAKEMLLIMCAGLSVYMGIKLDIERHSMQIASIIANNEKAEVRINKLENLQKENK